MIEIVMDKERNLKNLKQIGTPKDDDKIYVENLAYAQIKEESYKDKRLFVLMGHSERMQGHYATFVEAAIPVRDIEFVGNVPRWNNSIWSGVFKEIRRLYEDMIIVGWAIDAKGMSPKMTSELERVHREYFGGVHQVMFLLDTLEQEENFYVYKENRLVSKDGFYIYYHTRRKDTASSNQFEPIKIKKVEKYQVEVDLDLQAAERSRGGKYRQLMKEQKKDKTPDGGNLGLAIAVAMLVFVVGLGVYDNKDTLFDKQKAVETNLLQSEEVEMQSSDTTETSGANTIPVETIGGTEETEKSNE